MSLRSKARADEILRAAAAVFARRGFHRASVRDVAGEAGVSLAGLYYYVRSKDELLYRILDQAFDAILGRLAEVTRDGVTPEERVRLLMHRHLEYFMAHMDAMKVLSHETDSLSGEFRRQVAEKRRRYFLHCQALLRELDGGRRSPDALRTATLALFGMMNWIYTWYRADRDGDPWTVSKQMADLFLYGFAGAMRGDQA